jgi:hypothetical protein
MSDTFISSGNPTTLPTLDELAARIRSCREELTALRKLYRIVKTAEAAHKARAERHDRPADVQAGGK